MHRHEVELLLLLLCLRLRPTCICCPTWVAIPVEGDAPPPPPPGPGGTLTHSSMDEAPQPLPEQETKAEKGEDDADWLRLRLAITPPPEALEGRRSPGTTPATTTTTTSELRLFDDGPSSSSTPVEPPTVSCHMRVVSPARRSAGLWLVLQVDRTRAREQPPLPQIAKSYLRIRDGGMTVRLLIKYIINRLPLNAEEEAEVEITCRDQVLHPSLTLQYVRDNIWCARDAVLILPDSPNIDHVMRLLYRRRTSGMTR